MHEFWDFIYQFLSPESIISYGGMTLLIAIIFIETGLFFGFLFPGDSLLFTAGLLCATGVLETSIWFLIISLTLAAIGGNYIGYIFGHRVGKSLYRRKDTLFFKRKHVFMAKHIYEKDGAIALVIARFLPVLRTFSPIVAGIVKMDLKKFAFYNIIGAIAWVSSLTLIGYYLGTLFPHIKDYLHYVFLFLLFATGIPLAITYRKHHKHYKKTEHQHTEHLSVKLVNEK